MSSLCYQLAHQDTALGVGYFTPQPSPPLPLEACLAHICTHPWDEFMRGHARQILATHSLAQLRDLCIQPDSVLRGLVAETLLLTPALSAVRQELWPDHDQLCSLASTSPQIFLRSALLTDHASHALASALLRANIFSLQPIAENQLPALPDPGPAPAQIDIAALRSTVRPEPPCPRKPASETYHIAMERLYGLGIFDSPEMRHQASLSPWGLLRRWRLDRTVRCGPCDYRLQGVLTGYGRGCVLEDAHASLAMEIVERYSSFADIRNQRISGNQANPELIKARLSELTMPALDPNTICLEAPYTDAPLYWIEAETALGASCLVPFQCVYLFANLDEQRLFGALGSTGLAAGNTSAEAKLSGLLEVIERDSEAVTPFDLKHCFRLDSRDPELCALLEQYQAQGIDPIMQDITTELGVPCYRCFVPPVSPDQGLIKATGASLCGARAALSALTETPFPFPHGPASGAGPANLPRRMLEDLPDYSTGSATGDLALLEAILAAQGLAPIYVNLTKRELRLPVYRALVPGLEIVSDFDRFTRISPRLWRNVLTLCAEQK
ncbi:MAG: YcaO-like family protein [Desulfovibrionales bacterium]|nr:YcaO-like family protein [Desulfovibrionales bacterium]